MKARVFVRLKSGVLDPQGKAIMSGLQSLGFKDIADARMGKLIELTFAPGATRQEVSAAVPSMCEKLLANTVIEEYSFEIVE